MENGLKMTAGLHEGLMTAASLEIKMYSNTVRVSTENKRQANR